MMRFKFINHPSPEELALFSQGDLPLVKRWLLGAHLRSCPSCEYELERFRDTAIAIKRQTTANALEAVQAAADWSRLEQEMIGNINVGIAAARCVAKVPGRSLEGWRLAALVGGLTFVFVAGWLVNVPREDTDKILAAVRASFTVPQRPTGTVLQTSPRGVSIRFQGASLTLLHPSSAQATASFSSRSSVGVRYVDDQTGQVTITNVYGQ